MNVIKLNGTAIINLESIESVSIIEEYCERTSRNETKVKITTKTGDDFFKYVDNLGEGKMILEKIINFAKKSHSESSYVDHKLSEVKKHAVNICSVLMED